MAQGIYHNMHASLSGQNLVGSHVYPTYANPTTQSNQYNGVDGLIDRMGSLAYSHGHFPGQSGQGDGYGQHHVRSGSNSLASKANGSSQPHLRQYSPQYAWPASNTNHFQTVNLQSLPANDLSLSLATPRAPRLVSGSMPPVPELVEPRRTSWSSNDGHSPQTPTFSHAPPVAHYPGQSPAAFSTPSPMSASNPYYPHIWKNPDGEVSIVDFWELVNREPSIPEPVPALRSGPDGGRGTLDKILDNRDGTTNVYVRGLQPTTSDDMLRAYGEKFGPVVSCKSIIDATTGHCKGFGFIKYHNFVDAENCIRGFYHRGYEAKFARKSHNSRLKDLARTDNTNLYISNLPRLTNEDGLKAMFQTVFPEKTFPHHQAGSCKILKDSCGVSRGVGFARFETPTICDEIIESFNNRTVGEGKDMTSLQVRFADTEEQKQLKAFTAIKRQFKADEYNEAVYGVPFPHGSPASNIQSPLQARSGNVAWTNGSPASSVSPTGLGTYQYSVLRSCQTSSALGSESGPKSVFGNGNARGGVKLENIETPATAPKSLNESDEHNSNDGHSSSHSGDVTLTENASTIKSYNLEKDVLSPEKSKL